jgi:hypothetical protein
MKTSLPPKLCKHPSPEKPTHSYACAPTLTFSPTCTFKNASRWLTHKLPASINKSLQIFKPVTLSGMSVWPQPLYSLYSSKQHCSNLIFWCFWEQHLKINHFGTLSKSHVNSFMTTTLSEILKATGNWGWGRKEPLPLPPSVELSF